MSDTKILIVEDDPDFLELLRDFFSAIDVDVVEARTGEEAVNAAFAEAPDIILLDIMLPEKNGFEVCREIKADKRTKDISVIMLTGKNGLNNKLQGFLSGAKRYLTKPCELDEIEECFQSVIRDMKNKSLELNGLNPSQDIHCLAQ